MSLYKTILVPTDFSKFADNAIRYAHGLAALNQGTIHFAHVIDQRILDLVGMEGAYVAQSDINASLDSMKSHADKKMEQLLTRAKALGVDAKPHSCTGCPADEIARIADDIGADIIIIATHGRSGFDRLVLGSTCDRLIRESHVPVLSVKHPERDFVSSDDDTVHIARILCPCDFSDFSHSAVAHAVEWCKRFNATLVLMHVVDSWLDYPEFMPSADLQNSPLLAEKAQESLDAIAKDIKDVTVATHVESGIPHRTLTAAIEKENIDLVVMATHGRSGVPHLLLGSVAEKVARISPCPVMTIRPPAK